MNKNGPEAKLLVVDDEPNIRELLSASLRYAGFEVATATAGREAVSLAHAFRPDLVLLDDDAVIRVGDLELDDDAHEVRRGGTVVELSPTEFKLLRYLMLNPNRVLSKSQILDHVWEYDFNGDASIVESYISYLRRKVDIDPEAPALIQTKRGVGYVLRTAEKR